MTTSLLSIVQLRWQLSRLTILEDIKMQAIWTVIKDFGINIIFIIIVTKFVERTNSSKPESEALGDEPSIS